MDDSQAKVAVAAKKKSVLVRTMLIIVLTMVLTIVLLLWLALSKVEDLSGVWKSSTTGQTYVLDKIEDEALDYRLTVAGHRLLVESVDADSTHHQISLTVRTDSGLRAIWTFAPKNGADGKISSLILDQDGLATEDLIFQRALTNTDKVRISRLKPNKKILWSPAFNCEKAATDVERLICSSKELAAMDVQLSKLVKSADNNTQNVQKTWLKEVRNVCNDLSCLLSVYRDRLDTLTVVPEPVTSEAETEATEAE
jgi:hypothetical protein